MKKISILAVAALAMFSCSKNVNVNPNGPVDDQISFKPAISGMQKGSYTAMDNASNAVTAIDNDEFGVFMIADGTALANNVKFKYSGGIFVDGYASAPRLTWADLISGTQSNLDFYSYYPYSASATDHTNISVTVPTAQTMGVKDAEGNYTTQRTVTANDFIFSKNISDAGAKKTIGFTQADVPADRTVRFDYSHALAIVEFNVLNSAAFDNTEHSWLDKIELSGNQIYTAGTIDLSAEKPAVTTTTTGSISIEPKTKGQAADKLVSETKKDESTVIYQMLVMPMTASSIEDAKVDVTAHRGKTASYSSASAKNYTNSFGESAKWEAGKRYKYNIVVSENTIRIDLVNIDNWVEEDGGTLPVTPKA